jgi:Peptidase family M23
MKLLKAIGVAVISFFITYSLFALDVRFYPEKPLYLNIANGQKQAYDVIAHMVIIKNDSKEKCLIENVDYRYYANDKLIEEKHLPSSVLIAATNDLLQMNQQGFKVMTDVMLPPQVLGDSALAASETLEPGQVLTSQNIYVTLQEKPTRLVVSVSARGEKGDHLQATAEAKILEYKSANRYICPLKGAWYMNSVPNVTSHHRWLSETEFAMDFMKPDANGLLYKTDGKNASDYYAFGEPVFAAADGTVVTVINDAVQDWESWLQKPGESDEAFEKRSSSARLEAMKKDLYRAVTGNLVVIQHAGSEYSAYAHLKTQSVRVKTGDHVKQGQQIAEVGDTGDYYMAHLHFQISDDRDVLHARSLPFQFVDLQPSFELGHFLRRRN